MKSSKEYIWEDFLEDTEKTVEELEDIDELLSLPEESLDDEASQNIRNQFAAMEDEGLDFRLDGYMEISVSDDSMTAYGHFYPPSEGCNLLTYDGVIEILDSREITFGVELEEIQESLLLCNTERRPVTNVIVARGKPPENAVPAHYDIENHLKETRGNIDTDKQRVDFREISPFILVRKDDVLAKLVPKKDGNFGTNVFGVAVPYETEKIATMKPGKNTSQSGGTVTASCDGKFEIEGDTFCVSEVLQIENDVDYSTGHIEFPGDVVLKGEIKDGFRIHAGGSIYCSQTVDASEITSGKDLIIKKGIIGRKKGIVKIKGKLKAKFIENCYVEAGDTVYIETGIMNAAVYTTKKIELEKKGIIVGGIIYAQNGVTATQIGSSMGPRTEIHCGIDYIVSNKLEWIRDNNIKLAMRLKKIEEQLKDGKSSQEKLIPLREKIRQSIHKLNCAAANIIFKLDKNDEAEIVVRGKVYPGVYIEICHISYVVSREMTRVRFRLNKDKGIITADKLL
jgi:hypothetical protein